MEDKKVIAIFGQTGMVGSVIFNYYEDRGHDVNGRSLDNETPNFLDRLKEADYVFECVPTPYDWEKEQYDPSIVEEVLTTLKEAGLKEDCKVILKSTMTPGTTQDFQNKYPTLNLLFNPEFLSEATAEADFSNPDRQIVGYTDQTYKYATEVLHFLPESPYSVMMTSTEAEIVKYVNNFHGSLMVIFANLIFDVCQKTNSDFVAVKKASQASKWVGSPMGRMYWNVDHGNYRGYGGKCFPKDMNNLSNFLHEKGIYAEVLDAMIDANRRILQDQGLTEQEVEKLSNRKVTK